MNTLDRARRYLASCPPAISGSNGHGTTFTVATALTNGFALDRDSALQLLREYNRTSCTPPWSERELAHKVDQAIKTPHDKPRGHLLEGSNTNRPASNGIFTVSRLQAPEIPVQPMTLSGLEASLAFINSVFAPDDIVCICLDGQHDPETDKWTPASNGTFLPVTEWREILKDRVYWQKDGGVWIRINPTNPNDYTGSDRNVSSYRHVLIEFDDKPKEEQLAIIQRSNLPIAAVIDSGGKSLHAWVRVDAIDAREWQARRDQIYEYLLDAGVDPKNRNPSRFSRMPGAFRGQVEQKLIALNIGQKTWSEWSDWREESQLSAPTAPSQLLEYNTDADPNNVLGNRWLCRGGSLVIVGQSGVGKSSFAMQFGLTLALGKKFFGIAPVRPLRIALIQAENDRGDMAEALKGVVNGMSCSDDNMAVLEQNLRFYDESVKTGTDFIRLARTIIAKHKADILIADPLLAYAGDDISEQSFMSTFLRNHLNPVLQQTGCIWVWLHHMPKPPKGDQAKGTVSDLAYAGAGSADLTNWAREVAVLQREGDDPTFTFTLTKRGKRAGMVDSLGQPASRIRLRHSDRGICWQYAPANIFRPQATARTV